MVGHMCTSGAMETTRLGRRGSVPPRARDPLRIAAPGPSGGLAEQVSECAEQEERIRASVQNPRRRRRGRLQSGVPEAVSSDDAAPRQAHACERLDQPHLRVRRRRDTVALLQQRPKLYGQRLGPGGRAFQESGPNDPHPANFVS